MIRLFKIMFCKYYEWASKTMPSKETAAFNAASCVWLVINANLFSLWWLVTFFLGFSAKKISIEDIRVPGFFLMMAIGIFLNLVFVRKGKYLMICREFSGKDFRYRGLSKTLITRIYGISSLIIFIATAILYFRN